MLEDSKLRKRDVAHTYTYIAEYIAIHKLLASESYTETDTVIYGNR